MSHKIEGTPPPAVRSTGPVGGRITPAGADRSSPVDATRAADSLRLTGEATSLQALQRELSVAPAIDQARVAEVKQALESGTYRIDPAKIAERMLDLDKQLGG
jgi:negative regulator of flagellin synthesis FlgM